ncbi:MAG: hypothetical protein ABSG15_12610 [FCB group bacterium]
MSLKEDYSFKNSYSNTDIKGEIFRYQEEIVNYGPDGDTYNLVNEHYLQFGVNIKTKINKNLDYNFNFSLMKVDGMVGTKGHSRLIIFINGFNFDNDINFNRNWHWLQLGFGYGYDILGTLEKKLVPLVYGKIGYSSVKPDDVLFDNIVIAYDKTFSNFELDGGIKLICMLDPIELELNADSRKITGNPYLNIISLTSKINFIKNETNSFSGIDTHTKYNIWYYKIYLLAEYNKIFVSNLSQSAFNLGLGLDYYLK